jgi:RimJ/RimL family protein N-acetyltransferase
VYWRLRPSDLEHVIGYYVNPYVMEYETGRALKREEAMHKFERILEEVEFGWYKVEKRSGGDFIGLGKLTYTSQAEVEVAVGYGFLPPFWGNGYATELLRTFLNFIRRVTKVVSVVATTHPDNLPSIKVLHKEGFKLYDTSWEDEGPSEHYRVHINRE